jgi:hypothetical protein
MPQLPALLLAASAAVVLFLGTMHLVFTFKGRRFHPRDAELMARMQAVSPVLTRQTTMWKAWVGFNASHSYGAMLFGLMYGYLALVHPAFLFASTFLLGLGLVFLACFLVLAKRYWFRIPLRGLMLAAALYLGALLAVAF